ncbi:MAG TPA: hypothetical protein VHV82_05460 [Sporichthyaceae bacterium]|jgi:hypothetical protein|nr:hypothetical protein [Sporichthyaceae bacterium]
MSVRRITNKAPAADEPAERFAASAGPAAGALGGSTAAGRDVVGRPPWSGVRDRSAGVPVRLETLQDPPTRDTY